jgi:hypothetical protein
VTVLRRGQPLDLALALISQARVLHAVGRREDGAAAVAEAAATLDSCPDPGTLRRRLEALSGPLPEDGEADLSGRELHLGESAESLISHLVTREPCGAMESRATRGGTYRLVVRGELDGRFAYLFNGLELERVAGTTVLSGDVVDQAQLHGYIARLEELGLELVSIRQTAEHVS